MSTASANLQKAWFDRFSTPTEDELFGAFNRQVGAVIEHARSQLGSLPGVTQSLQWHGVPWRWSFTFTWDGEPDRPFAFVVPQPMKPLMAVSIASEVVLRLPARKLSKPTRDAIVNAVEVAGIHWPQWELTSKAQVDELMTVAAIRLQVGAAPSA